MMGIVTLLCDSGVEGRVQYTRLAKGLDRRNVQYQDDETRETLDDNEIEL
jgi:hypothetical protein